MKKNLNSVDLDEKEEGKEEEEKDEEEEQDKEGSEEPKSFVQVTKEDFPEV